MPNFRMWWSEEIFHPQIIRSFFSFFSILCFSLQVSLFLCISWLSSSLPQSKDLQVRFICDLRLPINVNMRVNSCLYLYVNPVMTWWPVQGAPHWFHSVRFAPAPCNPTIDKPLQIMDGPMDKFFAAFVTFFTACQIFMISPNRFFFYSGCFNCENEWR